MTLLSLAKHLILPSPDWAIVTLTWLPLVFASDFQKNIHIHKNNVNISKKGQDDNSSNLKHDILNVDEAMVEGCMHFCAHR